jgi:phosphatidate cytidylyltransferase
MAYIVGFFFGRTPLIRLSPKKTWEGFVGGFICTVIFGYFLAGFLAQFPYVTCPVTNLTTNSLSAQSCSPNLIFLPHQGQIPDFLLDLVKGIYPAFASTTFTYYPVQLHSLVLSTFASLVAPFGGFFASGVKRAFKVKDFGDSIPGHGGITDRMDCQVCSRLIIFLFAF